MDSLRIEIPQELFVTAESSSFAGELVLEQLDAGPDTYTFDGPLSWAVTVSNTGDALLVAGTVTGRATTACARCLEDVVCDVAGEVEGYFLLGDAQAPEDMEDDEFDVLPEDNVIDLEPLVVAAVLVDLPLIPLCREDCKGICPDCGADLNNESCDCAEKRAAEWQAAEEAANPFAALKDLKLD